MTDPTMNATATLTQYVDAVQNLGWTAMLLDDQWRIAWVSAGLQRFPDADEEHDRIGLPPCEP